MTETTEVVSYRVLDNLKTPKNEEGVVSTCRSGLKWADAKEGEIIQLQDRDENGEKRIYGKAEVVKVETALFKDMTDEQVDSNHGLHTRESLLEAMRNAYGPDFYGDCTVTVLFYQKLDEME